ncbi:MAG: hypothetical protein ACKOQ4_02255 [Mycobacterium sp.]
MHPDRFRALVDATATGPFVSLYFDDSHDTADAASQLDSRLRDVRKHLQDAAVDAAVVETLDCAVRSARPPAGRSGRAVITSGATVVLDEHLAVPPVTTTLRVSALPYIVPVVEHGMFDTRYLLVAVDHTGADIVLRDGGSHAESVRGSGYPVHLAHQAEAGEYGGAQGRVEEAVRRNIREVAGRLTHLVDEHRIETVFIAGDARADLAAALPDRVAGMVVQVHGGGRARGIDTAEVHREIAEEFTRRRRAAVEAAAQRFAAGHGTGLAVAGLADVTAALRDGAVDTLIIGDLGAATVVADHDRLEVIGPDAGTVSDLGGSPDRILRADEALPLLAVATGAALVRADGRHPPAGGVGAVLRYAGVGGR